MFLYTIRLSVTVALSSLLLGCGGDDSTPSSVKDSSSPVGAETPLTTSQSDDTIWNVSNISEFRKALENASSNGKNDTIILGAGTYKTTADGLGTFRFDDNEEFNLTIESAKKLTHKDVILDGEKTDRVFNFNNTKESTLTLKRISITNGKVSDGSGGGVQTNHYIKVQDCKIYNNICGLYGGGFSSVGTTAVINSVILNNSALSGGGFVSAGHGKTTLINSTISHNASANGAGFYAHLAVVNGSIFNDNNASANGAGFYAQGAIVNGSIFNGNNSSANGGGFYSNQAIVTNSLFENNIAKIGASFSVFSWTSYISNNNFIGNSSSAHAKGVFINNIFWNNIKDIRVKDNAKIYNNYLNYSQIEYGENVIKKSNLQPALIGNIQLNSDNKTLANNSPVIDKGLNPSSTTYKKIINGEQGYSPYPLVAKDETIHDKLLELLKTDMVGNKRVHNGTIDMGAVEYGSNK